jgi:hypothetical protein
LFQFDKSIQHFISHYKIIGLIPLDKFLHFTIGMLVTILLRFLGIRIRWVFVFLITLETLKEINDSFVLNSTWGEHLADFIVTLIFPLLLLIVIKIKKTAG